ncbi:hypothetical protein KTQ74_03620 [Pseudomonas chlororaphis]|uniref:Uncharacterized protein n=1 Tax=Pseudomonas chlororaphis TaxID=587753 RepID=A0A0D5XXL3_9PSED|nr:hypothetical protein [Pseudomonas chlororaphis]AKA23472.1 hypothetical protein PCL1606_20160 [Pseudomonas chlororaphis]MCB2250968.1 hypothetical protein [Pseudomonas chlororaphis]
MAGHRPDQKAVGLVRRHDAQLIRLEQYIAHGVSASYIEADLSVFPGY